MNEEKFGIDQLIASFGLLASEIIRFDISYFFEIIKWIEKDIGEINLLRNLQILPKKHSKDVKKYFINKIFYLLLEFNLYARKIDSDFPIVIDERILVSSKNIQYPPNNIKRKMMKKKLKINEKIRNGSK